MDVIMFNISAPPEKVVKVTDDSTGERIQNVIFKEYDSLNIETPSIILKGNTEIYKNLGWNYCKIPKLERYYYISGISTQGGLMVYDLSVDPLQSFSADILKSEQYIIRSEKYYNKLIVDPLLPLHSDHNLDIHPFGEDIYNSACDHVILETIGKGGTVS